jgi:antitoxin component YwqK of YwqJK toxin-antitoxin module
MDRLYYQNGKVYCCCSENRKEYFYEDGTLRTVEQYQRGRLEGESLLYWPDGKLKRKCSFVKGVRHGLDEIWNEEGVLQDVGGYEMGKAVGLHRRFSKNGTLIEEIEYLEGTRFNLRQWDDRGELKVEAIWIDSMIYREKAWDRFQNVWIEKEGFWNGKKLVYV